MRISIYFVMLSGILLALLFSASCFKSSGTDQSMEDSDECIWYTLEDGLCCYDIDCAADEFCDEFGTCQTGDCEQYQCYENFICDPDGYCYVDCADDNDCPPDQWCAEDGYCALSEGDEPDPDTEESLVTKQQQITLADFSAETADDEQMQALLNFAAEQGYAMNANTSRAGVLESEGGIRLILVQMFNDSGSPREALRFCENESCIYVLQTKTDDTVTWEDRNGAVETRQVGAPVLLKEIDDEDPNAVSVLVSPLLSANGALMQTTTPGRQFVVGSAFGVLLHCTFGDLIDKANQAALFDEVDENSYMEKEELVDYLKTMGNRDVLVWYAHGVVNKKGETVGMSTNWGVFLDETVKRAEIQSALTSNPRGGPGLVILGGCKSAGLIDAFAGGGRVVFGFNETLDQGTIARGIKIFVEALLAGDTYQQAMDKVNAYLDQGSTPAKFIANSGADLTKKLVEQECAQGFAGSWAGNLTVTSGTDLVPEGMGMTVTCGNFILAAASDDSCKQGCFYNLDYVNRLLEGCAFDYALVMGSNDSGVEMTVDIGLTDNNTLSVTITGPDSSGNSFSRSGTLTKCN